MKKIESPELENTTVKNLKGFFKTNTLVNRIGLLAMLAMLSSARPSGDIENGEPKKDPETKEIVMGSDNSDTFWAADGFEQSVSEKAANYLETLKHLFKKVESGNKLLVDSNNNVVCEEQPDSSFIKKSKIDKQKMYDKLRINLGANVKKQLPSVTGISMDSLEIAALDSLKLDKTMLNLVYTNISKNIKEGDDMVCNYLYEEVDKHITSTLLQNFLILGLPALESQFDVSKVSKAGATGMYQLMKSRAIDLDIAHEDRSKLLVIAPAVMKDFQKQYCYFYESSHINFLVEKYQLDRDELATYFAIGQWNWGPGRAKKFLKWAVGNDKIQDDIPHYDTFGAFFHMTHTYRSSGSDRGFGKDSFKYVPQSLALTQLLQERLRSD